MALRHSAAAARPTRIPSSCRCSRTWVRSYRPTNCFDRRHLDRRAITRPFAQEDLQADGSEPACPMGGLLRRKLRLATIEAYAVAVEHPGRSRAREHLPAR